MIKLQILHVVLLLHLLGWFKNALQPLCLRKNDFNDSRMFIFQHKYETHWEVLVKFILQVIHVSRDCLNSDIFHPQTVKMLNEKRSFLHRLFTPCEYIYIVARGVEMFHLTAFVLFSVLFITDFVPSLIVLSYCTFSPNLLFKKASLCALILASYKL